jgi:hypothetical protein
VATFLVGAYLAGATAFCVGQSDSGSRLHRLYDAHDWFGLRDAIEDGKAPIFYRGASESVFNQIKPAKKDLEAVIKAAPHSEDAHEARALLAQMYFRNGLYRESYLQLEDMQAEDPNAQDVKNMSSLLRVLSRSDQIVVAKRESALPMFMNGSGVYIPITLDGHEAHYSLDSGASPSLMSESEAKRLGLEILDTTTQMGSVTAQHFGARIAVVKDLVIGGLHLQNVAFDVLPDAQEPFVDSPEEQRGILGMPVLLAMQTFRWEPKGTFALGFKPKPKDLSTSNLVFDGMTPFTQVTVEHRRFEFSMDTGETRSILYAPFAKEFPDLIKVSGRKESHKLTGVAGSANYDSIVLPSVTLTLGGFDTRLAPAPVLMQESTDKSNLVFGNLGRDLLNQARVITFDFHAMTLRLQ